MAKKTPSTLVIKTILSEPEHSYNHLTFQQNATRVLYRRRTSRCVLAHSEREYIHHIVNPAGLLYMYEPRQETAHVQAFSLSPDLSLFFPRYTYSPSAARDCIMCAHRTAFTARTPLRIITIIEPTAVDAVKAR